MGPRELNKTTAFYTPVQEEIRLVESLMLAQAVGQHTDLAAALNHLLQSGGKRIRPTITILIGKALNGDISKLITLSAAIELLHTATLVHDDLIDGSLLRRGIPTLNSRWTPGATVLTGDFLFACAAKLASDTGSLQAMSIFSKTLQIIVNGEITQLFTSRCKANKDDYFERIYAKTASLFETAATTAAVVSVASNANIEFARLFGLNTGIAFQIIDDIMDFTENESTMGKPAGNDLRQGLVTLPALYYILAHPEDASVNNLKNGLCIETEDEIKYLISKIKNSESIELARDDAKKYIKLALENLRKLPSNEDMDYLADIISHLANRKY